MVEKETGTAEGTDERGNDILDGLPDGSEGWGYIEEAGESLRSDDSARDEAERGEEEPENRVQGEPVQEEEPEKGAENEPVQEKKPKNAARDEAVQERELEKGAQGEAAQEEKPKNAAQDEPVQEEKLENGAQGETERREEKLEKGAQDEAETDSPEQEETASEDTHDIDDTDADENGAETHEDEYADDGLPATEALEKAAASDVPKHEISKILEKADLDLLGKTTVTAFVRGADADVSEGTFCVGDVWTDSLSHDDDIFVELGWTDDDGVLTAQGAAVLSYARDLMSGSDGTDAVLVGYLNGRGVDVFLKEAIRRGPDEPDDSGGFLSRLLG